MRFIALLFGHCLDCTSLSGCYFMQSNMPRYPLHDFCDCKQQQILHPKAHHDAFAYCPIEKITKYAPTETNGKFENFRSMGFTKEDGGYIKYLLEELALEKYIKGEYELKDLDHYGQRISIVIELNGKKFITGWMVHPLGYIQNTTHFRSWVKEK